MNELELRKLKSVLEDLFEKCRKGHHGSAMKKVTVVLLPMLWEKVEEKLKEPEKTVAPDPRPR